MKDIRCVFGFHKKKVVLNTQNNKITEICSRCKEILSVEQGSSCCGNCIAADMNWRTRLKKQGDII